MFNIMCVHTVVQEKCFTFEGRMPHIRLCSTEQERAETTVYCKFKQRIMKKKK